jgi:hypothetical protein
MGVKLPNGASFSIASAYGDAVPFTEISNAIAAVLAAANNNLAINDVIEVASGWAGLDGRIARATAVAADSVTLGGVNTLDAARFPPGAGVGTLRKVEDWVQISQILESASSGGEQQFANFSFLEDTGDERQIPTIRSARSVNLTVADDDKLPHYAVLKAANDDRRPRAIRFQLPGGAAIYFGAYVSFGEMPTTTKNEVMSLQVTLSLTGAPTRYSA